MQVGRDVQRHSGERAAEHHYMESGSGRARAAEHRSVRLRRARADSFSDKRNQTGGLVLGVGAICEGNSPRSCDCRFARCEQQCTGGERGTGRSARTISNWDWDPVQRRDFARVSHRGEKSRRFAGVGADESG